MEFFPLTHKISSTWSSWKRPSILKKTTFFVVKKKSTFALWNHNISVNSFFWAHFVCRLAVIFFNWLMFGWKKIPSLREISGISPMLTFGQISKCCFKTFILNRHSRSKICLVYRLGSVLRTRIQSYFLFLRWRKNVDTHWNWVNPGRAFKSTTCFPLYLVNNKEFDFRSAGTNPESS